MFNNSEVTTPSTATSMRDSTVKILDLDQLLTVKEVEAATHLDIILEEVQDENEVDYRN
jgi:hypothetical protein